MWGRRNGGARWGLLFDNWMRLLSPLVPCRVMKIAAAVPAPGRSPVTVWTVYAICRWEVEAFRINYFGKEHHTLIGDGGKAQGHNIPLSGVRKASIREGRPIRNPATEKDRVGGVVRPGLGLLFRKRTSPRCALPSGTPQRSLLFCWPFPLIAQRQAMCQCVMAQVSSTEIRITEPLRPLSHSPRTLSPYGHSGY